MPKIKVNFSFLLFNSLVFMFRESRMIWGFYAACIIHEAGHIIAVRAFGGEVVGINFSWFGIKMTATPPASKFSGIIILLSGPAANLFTYVLLILRGNIGYFAIFSLAEGLFNLLPYSFLDGGAALELFAEGMENERLFRNIFVMVRIIVPVIIIIMLYLYY